MSVMTSQGSQRFLTNTVADLTATQYLELFRKGELTALEYAQACADRIEELNPTYAAFEVWNREGLEERAARIDANPRKLSLAMAGVPSGVKDNINTYDFPTGRGTKILKDYTPGNDARVVSNMRLEGSLVVGKTVTAEFAVHSPGATLYPFDTERSPGTSSSGSAVAVATRMVPVALGTQTGGSIIRPASYCGILGYKPSFGTLARTGVLKTTDTLDTVGLMARSVDDLRLTFDVARVRGHNYPVIEKGFAERNALGDRPWKVGVVVGPKTDQESAVLQSQLESIAAALAVAGCQVVPVRLPDVFSQAHDTHERIYSKALSYYLREEFEWKPELFSGILREMMEVGATISPEQYHQDTQYQAEIAWALDQVFANGVDVLIGLATAAEAPVGLATRDVPDHNLIWTMCGVPVVSVPMLTGENGLPVGVSVVTRKYADYLAFDFATYLQQVAG